jgi:hypothetical protein
VVVGKQRIKNLVRLLPDIDVMTALIPFTKSERLSGITGQSSDPRYPYIVSR